MVRCTIIQDKFGALQHRSQPPGFSGFLDQPRRSRKKRLGRQDSNLGMAESKSGAPAVALKVDDTRRSLSCCVNGVGKRTARKARPRHDVMPLGYAERRLTQ
jgi:hypothetical protein